jgi:hypothetical protein
MPIEVTCQCGKRIKAKDELAGRRVKCPGCSQPLAIPAPTTAEAAPQSRPSDAYSDLFDDIGLGQQTTGPVCESCRAPIPEKAVLCIQCGYNSQTKAFTRTNIGGDADNPVDDLSHLSETEAILARAAMVDDDDESDLDDDERYGTSGQAWLIGLIMLIIFASGMGGVYYYNAIYIPTTIDTEPEDEF